MKSRPVYKICRRLGSEVFDKCQTQKYTLSEQKHSKNFKRGGRRNVSDYGKQLMEKQKVRFAYGIKEKQLRKYAEEAKRVASAGGNPNVRMIEQLEMRVDNVIYKLGFATTRRFARQMVSHGHVQINGVRTTIPSVQLKVGDVVTLRDRTKKLPIMEAIKVGVENSMLPAWITFDLKKFEGKVVAKPTPENTEMPGDVGAIMEFYSR
jgi:small subunit ribosomal protein S4